MGWLQKLFKQSASMAPLAKPGRNDLCWCGSGKKYKQCHLESDLKHPAPIARKACGSFG